MTGPNDREESNSEKNTDNRDSVTEFEKSLEDALRDGIHEDMNNPVEE